MSKSPETQSATIQVPPVVSLEGVGVTYVAGPPWARKKYSAARNVSLTVAPGEIVGIVGESGSGKTTVSKLVLGLVKPDSGQVLFAGRPVKTRTRSRKGEIQVVLQHPEWALNPFLRVSTSVAEPLAIAGEGSARSCRSRVLEMLERVGISEAMAERYPHELSGGQRQRAAIARALIARPRLVVFDEAVSALDVSAQAQVLNLICETQAEFGYAALFISHDLAAVRYVSDRVVLMSGGEVADDSRAADFFAAEDTADRAG